jgi:hypothetical protein
MRQVQQQQIAAEQGDVALPAIVAGIAVLEVIDAPQAQAAIVIARRAQPAERDGVIEQQQVFGRTGGTRSGHPRRTCLEAVEPEPGESKQNEQADRFHPRHDVFPNGQSVKPVQDSASTG